MTLRWSQEKLETDNCNPLVSIVVPCRNERENIETTVNSILAQDPPVGGFEVIVADGMSDDGTREILQRIALEDPRLTIVDNPRNTTACGMNVGICQARGHYIAIMGAHNRYSPDYLKSAIQVLTETGADNVGGSMTCVGESILQRLIALAHHSPFSVGGATWHNVNYDGPADTVFGGVYRRDVFYRIGLFDEELVRNQDDELNLRLIRAGGKIWHSPRIKSWYVPRNSLAALFRQYAQYGYWKVRVIQKHRLPSSFRHLVPGTFVFTMMLLLVVGLVWRPAFWWFSALLALYFLSNIVAAILTHAPNSAAVFLLPLVFATYHVGYGLGFLRGVLDFVVLRRGPSGRYSELTRRPLSATTKK